MKKVLKLLIFLLLLLSIESCKDSHPFERGYRFWIENESDDLIYFLVSYSYPDTIIPDSYDKIKGVSVGSETPYDSDDPWEEVFDELPSDTLSIFIFDGDSIDESNWQEIREGYKILKRFDISYDDLKQNKWIVTYP